ncbi:MAG: thiosulfate oxidation carrier complex protein SoxZ [Chloroflexota bacterium]
MADEFNVRVRLPRNIAQGDVIEFKIKIKHPSRTGLAMNEEATRPYDRFVRAERAQYIRQVEVFYGDDQISTVLMNASTSDDPLLAIKLRADKEAPVSVVVTNHNDETVEASADLVFA